MPALNTRRNPQHFMRGKRGTKTQSSKARIKITITTTQSSVARIAKSFTKTQSAHAFIPTSRTQFAVARIGGGSLTNNQSAAANIAERTFLTFTGLTPNTIYTFTVTSHNGVGGTVSAPSLPVSTVATSTAVQQSVARIAKTFTKTQSAKAHLLPAGTVLNQTSSVARIVLVFTKTQSAKANIVTPGGTSFGAGIFGAGYFGGSVVATHSQSVIARFKKTLTTTHSSVSRLVSSGQVLSHQFAKARVINTLTKTRSAIARIGSLVPVPSSPTNVVAGGTVITSTSLSVNWTASTVGLPLSSPFYVVTALIGGVPTGQTQQTIDGTTTALVFGGLTPNTLYQFTITAHNDAGTSSASTPSPGVRTTLLTVPSQSVQAYRGANQHTATHITAAIGAGLDVIGVQIPQVDSTTRNSNTDLKILLYLNGTHDRPDDTQGTFGPYSPPADWFLYDAAHNKILAGVKNLMDPMSNSPDGHGHNGWGGWLINCAQKAATPGALVSGVTYDGIFWDVLGSGSAGMTSAINPRTGQLYTTTDWDRDCGDLGSRIATGFPSALPHYQIGNGLKSGAQWPLSRVLLQHPLFCGDAENFLRHPPNADLTWFPSNVNAQSTYAQNLTFLTEGTSNSNLLCLQLKLWNGSDATGGIPPSGPAAATPVQIDQWIRVGMGIILCGYNGFGTAMLDVETWQGDVTDYPMVRCHIGQPTATLIQSGSIWSRTFEDGLVVLNTSSSSTSYTFPSSGGPWTDVGTVGGPAGSVWGGAVYTNNQTVSIPADFALILSSSGAGTSTPPGAPTNPISATVDNLQSLVSWGPAAPNGAAVTKYTVTATPGNHVFSTPDGTTLSQLVIGLTNGTLYTFSVTATNNAGTGPPSNTATATPGVSAQVPSAPTNLTATVTATGEVTLNYTPSSSHGDQPITSYIGVSFPATSPVSVASGPIIFTSLPGTSYQFSIHAHSSSVANAGNGVGNSLETSRTPSVNPNPVGPGVIKPAIGGLLDTSGSIPAAYLGVVKGIVFDVTWASLQPTQGGPLSASGIAAIQGAVNYVTSLGAGYYIRLRVHCGKDAPNWAKNIGGAAFTMTDFFSTPPVSGTCGRWWLTAYGTAYTTFMSLLGAQFDSEPRIRDVSITQTTTIYGESFQRGGTSNKAALVAAGLTSDAQDLNSIQASIDNTIAGWPTTRCVLSLTPYQSQFGGAGAANTIAVAQYGFNTYGKHFVCSNNGLRIPRLGGEYVALYAWMTTHEPSNGQTARTALVGNLLGTISDAISMNFNNIELPSQYSTLATPAQLAPLVTQLNANAAAH